MYSLLLLQLYYLICNIIVYHNCIINHCLIVILKLQEWFPLPSSDKESFESHTLKEDDIEDQISDINDKAKSSCLSTRSEKNESSKETELSEMLPVSYDTSVMALRRNLNSEHYDNDANKVPLLLIIIIFHVKLVKAPLHNETKYHRQTCVGSC